MVDAWLVVAGFVVVLALGAAIGVAVARSWGRPPPGAGTAALDAVLAVERERTVEALRSQLALEREASTRATVDTVLAVAGDRLGAHAAAASRELDQRQLAIDRSIGGMNDELHRMADLVHALGRERATQHAQLVGGIDEAIRATASLGQTTQALREALSNSRARGQWGERMAEDVLRAAGFVEGINYRRQHTLGSGARPDLTFVLPRDRVLHLDVKFPIDNYLRHLDAPSEHEREQAALAFSRDVRQRVKELSAREYRDPATTLGYVLLFIPNEAVYAFAFERDPALLDHALAHQVVLCSPTTLFAVLGVIRQAVDTFLLERTSDEILACLRGVSAQWARFSERLDRLGQQLATVHNTYDDVAGPRRRQLQKELDRVEQLRQGPDLDDTEPLRLAK